MDGQSAQPEGLSVGARLRQTPPWTLAWTLALITFYLGTMGLTSGIRGEELVPCAMMLFSAVWSDRTRKFLVGTLPLTFYGIVYDLTHITEPLVQKLTVHVAQPYHFELAHFGVRTPDGLVTLNELFARHHWPWLDLVTGTAYLAFLYWVLLFGFYLVWTGTRLGGERERLAKSFTWAFFFMNVVGFATYYIYPSAPPWYVSQYGLGPANFAVQASPAAAIRWDQLTGLHYFQSFYGKSADIFGAIPSLHVAQPLLAFLYARMLKRPWLDLAAGSYFLLVCFSAIYLQHHYVLDVLIGCFYALSAFGIDRFIRHVRGRPSGAGEKHVTRRLPFLSTASGAK